MYNIYKFLTFFVESYTIKIMLFDIDALETSSLVDNYEINSGGIYVPDRTIYTMTKEGSDLASAKNDYLEERLALGENATEKEVRELVDLYHNKINYDEVIKYFNN